MLMIIESSLSELLENSTRKLNDKERVHLFLENNENVFSRKDYMNYFKDISSATASRDLKNAVENGIISKTGDKKTTTYKKN